MLFSLTIGQVKKLIHIRTLRNPTKTFTMSVKSIVSLFILIFLFQYSQAQTDDNVLWAGLQWKGILDDKTSIAVKPILRLDENFGGYQNSSIDLSIKRSFGKGFYGQFLSRTWFMPDRSDRQFLWFDIGYGRPIGSMKINTAIRMHYAIDIKDIRDGDFIRWKTTFFTPEIKNLRAFGGVEPWFGFNNANEFQRIRYEAGLIYKLPKSFFVSAALWREVSINIDPGFKFNLWLVTFGYTMDFRKDKE